FTVVYAHPQERSKEELWRELERIGSSMNGPWCVGGDFNTILFDEEKMGGGPPNHGSMRRFEHCLLNCSLSNIGFKGTPFTWQRGELQERLDRVVANDSWRSLFHNASLVNVPLVALDHTGLWLKMGTGDPASNHNSQLKVLFGA
ncbi:MAG: hypothetical protein Q8736_02810, partial [Sweet potato little leaf phytoplasma]|nr:hypothetical protein [Sweet potato little leaf phytoplasma]